MNYQPSAWKRERVPTVMQLMHRLQKLEPASEVSRFGLVYTIGISKVIGGKEHTSRRQERGTAKRQKPRGPTLVPSRWKGRDRREIMMNPRGGPMDAAPTLL